MQKVRDVVLGHKKWDVEQKQALLRYAITNIGFGRDQKNSNIDWSKWENYASLYNIWY